MNTMGSDCLICGRCATGVHYGVLACEGCKAFYRREVKKNDSHLCFFGGKCSTDYTARVRCNACRFRKCQSLGMKVKGLEVPGLYRCPIKKTQCRKPNIPSHELDIEDACMESQNLQFNTVSSSTKGQDFCSSDYESSMLDELANTDFPDFCQAVCAYNPNERGGEVMEETSESSGFMDGCRFPTFSGCYWESLNNHMQEITLTIYAVAGAVEVVFGDQISRFQWHMNQALINGEIPHEPQATLETMIFLMNEHNRDSRTRTRRFADMLPGTSELNVSPSCLVTLGWKSQVLCMMHHSAFMTPTESYVYVGPDRLHYGRYWQEMTTEPSLVNFVFQFCEEFRKIGLNQTETYIVMAVVMFEPSEETAEESCKLKLLHRHYTDVLVDALKRRCADTSELFEICRRLERFFGFLKMACQLHRQHFPGQGTRCIRAASNCVWQH